MDPLDLTVRPPRSPHVQLDGLDMMPRTIDKMRALLPGGNIGQYKIDGSSKRLLDFLGIRKDELQEAVAAASSEDDVAAWLRAKVSPERYAQANAALSSRTVGQTADPAGMRTRYPLVKDITDDTTIYDVLDMDDAAMFPGVNR
jgi:hypothetical protein